MPPIRELFFAAMVLMLLAYGGILFVGGYEVQNGLQVNSTIASNYNSIVSASALPSGFFSNASAVSKTVNTTASGVNNTGSSGSTALTNSVGLVVGFMTTIPTLYGAIVNFIAIPMVALGVPVGYAQIIINVVILGIIALSIVSAIFLFPV